MIPILPAADMEESPASPMNTTGATEGEQQQQQQTNTTMLPTPLLE
ncbi:MAG TPA: hypothetical protein VFR94_07920 [Nitrososphaeraceae archaeon]|nr:hypothetical protein [Nitrososphaeraceae archaeon]